MRRRSFLKQAGMGLVVCTTTSTWMPWGSGRIPELVRADVVIIGGGVGGTAAALAAARSGLRVVLTEETDWIGGQLTQQGVPPDEHPWIEDFGRTRSYAAFRQGVRDYYRTWYPLTGEAIRNERFNPGNCAVSSICHEPRVALSVLEGMLAQYVSSGHLTLLLDTVPVAAEVQGDRVQSVRVQRKPNGEETTLEAPYFLDATELGDLLPMTGTEYVTGAESVGQTGERHAAPEPQPDNVQAFTWCFAMEHREGEDHTLDRPETYDFWRDYVPEMTPSWSGRLLDWSYSNPATLAPRRLDFDPRPNAQTEAFNLWGYRRLIDPSNFQKGHYASGMTLVNWPQNDYWRGNVIYASEAERVRYLEEAKQLSLSLLYWMQTEAPRPDGGVGWPGLRLRGDVMGTAHGLAKRPYYRESRRIKAVFTVKEQHVGLAARMEETGLPEGEVRAASFPDAVGVGSYRIDLHPSTGGNNYIDFSALPFEIPLGALLPERMENLLPACKNLGVTHLTNGCYRLHPVEWNIGEAAGLLAAFCVEKSLRPHYVRENQDKLADFQRYAQQHGIPLHWPEPLRTPR